MTSEIKILVTELEETVGKICHKIGQEEKEEKRGNKKIRR